MVNNDVVPNENKSLSPITISIVCVLLLGGLLSGAIAYSHRSPILESHVPGINAIPAHVVVTLILVIAAFLYFRRRQKVQFNGLLLLAPFSKRAFKRFTDTLLVKRGFTVVSLLRIPVVLLLIFFLLYNFPRSAFQIFYMFDHNAVVNAWGGPTPIGASVAHWLDGILLFYVEAALLNWTMVKYKN